MRTDPFEIAVEHAAWCIRDGQAPADVLAALGMQRFAVALNISSPSPTWNDVVWALALSANQMVRIDEPPLLLLRESPKGRAA